MIRNFLDAHCHIHYDDISLSLQRAREMGVKYLLNIFEVGVSNLESINVLSKEENVFLGLGVHPNNVEEIEWSSAEEIILNHMSKIRVIGETGLDLSRRTDNLEKQMQYLSSHMELGLKYNKPLVIHARSCNMNDITSVIKGKFQLHCFTFGVPEAKMVLEKGGYISISGILTFQKNGQLEDVIKYCPLSSLLVESDSPFLAPVPHRGKKNEPRYVIETYKRISSILEIEISDLAHCIERNFREFLDLEKQESKPISLET